MKAGCGRREYSILPKLDRQRRSSYVVGIRSCKSYYILLLRKVKGLSDRADVGQSSWKKKKRINIEPHGIEKKEKKEKQKEKDGEIKAFH